jgi:hypothetical protein
MSLCPEPIGSVPEETARIAHAVFRRGNVYLKMRDELGTLYEDTAFASLFPRLGQPAEAPWRLVAFVAPEEEAEATLPVDSGHARIVEAILRFAFSAFLRTPSTPNPSSGQRAPGIPC